MPFLPSPFRSDLVPGSTQWESLMHGPRGSTEGWKGNTAPGKSIKLAGFPNPFSLMFLCKFVRWEWNCLVTLQTWRTSLKKITYLSKQGGIYVGVPEMWFYSVCFLCAHQSNWRDKKKRRRREKTRTQLVYGYFFTLPPFLLLFSPSVCLAPSSPLCLLSVMLSYHAAAPWGKEQWFLHNQGHSKGTNMISLWTEPGSVG